MDHAPNPMPAEDLEPGYKLLRTRRHAVDSTVALNGQNQYRIEVTVRDVSTTGFMAECPEPVRIGAYVTLDVPGIGVVHAQVRWQIGVRMGGMFLDPISLARCEWVGTRADSTQAD